jgi:hypothetical protein
VTPEDLFYGFPEPVPAICWKLRDLVLEAAPGAAEAVRPRWRSLGFSLDDPATPFCSVAPQKDHARVVFDLGVELPDPERKLLGAGTSMRFLQYDALDEVEDEVVRRFVRLAFENQSAQLGR